VNAQGRLSVLAVDADRLALEDLGQLLNSSARVTETACASSASEALRLFATRQFDALFSEVRMPGFDGLELAGVLNRFANPPAVVFVSANEDGAARAFELGARDYLRKPVTQRRLEEALSRVTYPADDAEDRADTETGPSPSQPVVGVHRPLDEATRIISLSSILYVSAQRDYVRIVADTGRYLQRATITEIDRRWKSYGFHRVHRAYVVNLRRAREMRPQLGGTASLALVDGTEIPVARRHSAELRRLLRM
jgi:two-component system, LytTR family, response regulator